jgi:hypothetical protein
MQVKVGGQDGRHPPPVDRTSTQTSSAVQEGTHPLPASPFVSTMLPSALTQTAPNKPLFWQVSPEGQDPQSIVPPQPLAACPHPMPKQFVGMQLCEASGRREVSPAPPSPILPPSLPEPESLSEPPSAPELASVVF